MKIAICLSWLLCLYSYLLLIGSIGSAIATPTDLVKVRQQAEGKGVQRRYNSTFAAFGEIYRAGGVRALYVGMGPTVKRATILTATQVRWLIFVMSNMDIVNSCHFVFQYLKQIAVSVVNYGISNTIVLEIPQFTTKPV